MTLFRWVPCAAACCLLAAAVSACGGTRGGGSVAGGTTTAVPSTTAPGSGTAPTSPSGLPTSRSGLPLPTGSGLPRPSAVVVRGVIEKGVEAGCWVLTPDQAGPRYVVITTTAPPTGVPVTVYGIAHPDQVSYCQQGTVLAASRIERR